MMKILNVKVILGLLLSVLIFSFSANAAMYKWVDENGNTHYSQSPPNTDVVVETIKPPPKVDTDGANKQLEKQKKNADKLRKERISTVEEKKKQEEELAKKKRDCDDAKKRLASYQRPRVNIENPDGSITTVPEEQRQAEIKKSQEYVDKACN